jgi:hypothetical protein
VKKADGICKAAAAGERQRLLTGELLWGMRDD